MLASLRASTNAREAPEQGGKEGSTSRLHGTCATLAQILELIERNPGVCTAQWEVEKLLDDAFEFAELFALHRNVTVLRCDEAGVTQMRADQLAVLRALIVGLLSAINESPKGGTVRVKTRALENSGLALDIYDRGQPIDESVLEQVTRQSPSTELSKQEFGLLPLSVLTQRAGGTIEVGQCDGWACVSLQFQSK